MFSACGVGRCGRSSLPRLQLMLSSAPDTYHSHPSIFALHDCVLLSILSLQNDVLEELDANEARHVSSSQASHSDLSRCSSHIVSTQLLLHLPKLDMDRILASAVSPRTPSSGQMQRSLTDLDALQDRLYSTHDRKEPSRTLA